MVTAGAPRSARPAKGCMYCWYVLTESLTDMHEEPAMQKSGSLKDIKAGAPAAMARLAADGQALRRSGALEKRTGIC